MAERGIPFKIIEIDKPDYTLWDEFVVNSTQGTFFHTSKWSDIIADVFERQSRIVLCLKNDQPVAGMSLLLHRKYFLRMITPTPLFPYTAPVFYTPHSEKSQKTIYNQLSISAEIEKYLKKHFKYWIMDTPPVHTDMRSYLWQGASVEPKYSYIIHLDDENKVFGNFNQSTRKKIKQAQNEGANIIESQDYHILIELLNLSYKRHGLRPLFSKDSLDLFLQKVINLPQIKLYILEMKGAVKAARLVLVDDRVVYDLLAGSEDDSGTASTYLVFHILRNFITGNHHYFDFMGADHPQIEQFKRGFGGELVQGFRVTNKQPMPLSWLINIYRKRLIRTRNL
jgi:lipid II:glycine glycyltransferase (peptidoglycan interpeptide bridge formation enzyme)